MNTFQWLISEFIRKHIKANYRAGDHIISLGNFGANYDTATDFLRSGKVSRIADIIWRIITIPFCLLLVIIVPIAIFHGAFQDLQWWLIAFAVVMWLMCVWLLIVSQSYLRWMIRHWKKPRKKQR